MQRSSHGKGDNSFIGHRYEEVPANFRYIISFPGSIFYFKFDRDVDFF